MEQIIKNAYQVLARDMFSVKQKCLWCQGYGKLPDYDRQGTGSTACEHKICHHCNGKGEVTNP